MTKKEKTLVIILGIIALLIIGYNAYLNAINKGVDVKVTIDRNISNDNTSSDNLVDETYSKLIERTERRKYIGSGTSNESIEVYDNEEEVELLEQERDQKSNKKDDSNKDNK